MSQLTHGGIVDRILVLPRHYNRSLFGVISHPLLTLVMLVASMWGGEVKSDGDVELEKDHYRFYLHHPNVWRNQRKEKTLFVHVDSAAVFVVKPKGTYVCNGVEKSKWFKIDMEKSKLTVTKPTDDVKFNVMLSEAAPNSSACACYCYVSSLGVDVEDVDLLFNIYWKEFWREKVDGKWVVKSADKSMKLAFNQTFSKYVHFFMVGALLYGGDEGKFEVYEKEMKNGPFIRESLSEALGLSTPSYPEWTAGGGDKLHTDALPRNNCFGWWALAGGKSWSSHVPPEKFYGHVSISGSLHGGDVDDAKGIIRARVKGESILDKITLVALKVAVGYLTSKLDPVGSNMKSIAKNFVKTAASQAIGDIEKVIGDAKSWVVGAIGEHLQLLTTDGVELDSHSVVSQYNAGERRADPGYVSEQNPGFGIKKGFSCDLERPGMQGVLGHYGVQGFLLYSVNKTDVRGKVEIPTLFIKQELAGVEWKPARPEE